MVTQSTTNSNAVALVTGGSSGIGAASVKAFLAKGVTKVVVADYSDSLTSAVQAFSKAYPDAEIVGVKTDVSDEAQVKAMVATAVDKFGRLDYAVNCAGIGLAAPFTDTTTELYDKVTGVNERGVFLCVREQLIQMLKQDYQPSRDDRRKQRGAIVNIASILGQFSCQNTTAYVSSKHAVCGLTKSASFENSSKGVRVNAIAPGWIDTPMTASEGANLLFQWGTTPDRTPLGRGGYAEEIADVVVFLCSEEASFVTGAVWNVDGGYSTV